MANSPLYAVVWILLLIFIAWPVAGFLAGIWILIQPFESLAPFFKQINDFLEKLITWPRDVGLAIKNCQTTFPAPTM
ncbi:hypothetical protein MHU86_14365 [Fragilaria crotonensis]|nr:hypothetical protein MHU86_14365 [Fragilaria crotonensis]